MSFEIIIQIVLFGLALSADAMSVAITEGLTFADIDKKKALFIALIFGLFQGLFPLMGYWLVEGVESIVSISSSEKIAQIVATSVTWISGFLLLFLGIKMIVEVIKELKQEEIVKVSLFSYKVVLIMGVATAIDALASGVAFHNNNLEGLALSNNRTIWLHVAIIMVITFTLSLIGVVFGRAIEKLFKGKYEIVRIIGGAILIILAFWIVLSHYLVD